MFTKIFFRKVRPLCALTVLVIFFTSINHSYGQKVSYATRYTDATFPTSVDLSLPVGVVEGSHNVTATGAATYSIPIKVPPGTNGMQPNISINYNSQAPNGLCGWGWGIGGVSIITRAGKNYWNDDRVEPIMINNNDAFTLDGSRLTPLSGSNGANNTVYGTEAETYAKITSYGSFGSGPQYFKVWMKNGSIWEYGNTSDSRLMVNSLNNIMAWKVNKVTDANGNYMTFSYTISNAEQLLDEIWYSGNPSIAITPYNHLKFEYKNRDDANTLYEAGDGFYNRNLLTSVKSYGEGNQLVHNYTLTYTKDNLYSLLQEVSECGFDNTCFNTTKFKYGDETVAANDMDVIQAPGIFYNGTGASPDVVSGDFNGDGFSDILQFWKHVDNNVTYTDSFKVKLKNPYGTNFYTSYTYSLPGDYQVINSLNVPNAYNYHVSDFDGDGTDDILLGFRKKYATYTELDKILIFTKLNQSVPVISTYNAPAPYTNIGFQPTCIYPGDYDGDGRVDFISVVSNGASYKTYITCPGKGYLNEPVIFSSTDFGTDWYTYPSYLAFTSCASAIDFDGNGRHELFFVKKETYDRPGSYSFIVGLTRDGNGTWTANKLWSSGYPTQWHTILFGDFNGDKKTDLFTRTNNSAKQWEMALSTGQSYFTQNFTFESNPAVYQNPPNYSPSAWDDDLFLLNDFNGDGKTDILQGKTYWSTSTTQACNYTMYNSIGAGQTKITRSSTPYLHGPWYCSADFNSDGKADFVSYEGGRNEYKLFTFRGGAPDRLLNKISDGFGNVTVLTHKLLTDKGIANYTWSGNEPYPFNNIISPIWCVRNVDVPNGIGGIRDVSYRYGNARFHKAGKGFLGFSTFKSSDNNSLFETEQSVTFDQNLYIPQQTVTVTTSNGQDISRKTLNYQNTALGNKRFKQELSTTYSEDLLAGTWASSATVYDAYSNPVKTSTNTFNIQTSNVETIYTPGSTTGTPVDVKPSSITTTTQRLGAPQIIDRKLFGYNGHGLLINKVDFFPLTNQVSTDYAYTAAGNLFLETMYAAGLPSKTNNYFYDSKERFLNLKINAAGQQESMSYDGKWGVITKSTGIDGVTTDFQYDGFGRPTATIYTNYTSLVGLNWNQDPATGSLYQKTAVTPGKPETITDIDALGRTVKTSSVSWSDDYPTPWGIISIPQVSTSEKTYDALGNLATETEPHYYFEPNYLTNNYTYDWLLRPQSTCDAIHGCSSYSYNYSANKLTASVTDGAGHTSSKTTDATGMLVQSTDGGGKIAFTYNSRGQQLQATTNGITVRSTYDDYGRQIYLFDPGAGNTAYEYNAWGELIKQKDANGNTHIMDYNILGDIIKRSGPEGGTTYGYYSGVATGAINKLKSITDFNGNIEEYVYDNLGRTTEKRQIIAGRTLNTFYDYDQFDRLSRLSYNTSPIAGINIVNYYNGYGTLMSVNYNGKVLYQCHGVNGKGQVNNYARNNGQLNTLNEYNYGYLTRKFTNYNVQDYNVTYDYATGNVMSRSDAITGLSESFNYDGLDRLVTSQVSNGLSAPQNVLYAGNSASSNGNIKNKTDVGDYGYAKVTAVNYINNTSALVPTIQQDIKYTPFLKTASVDEGIWRQAYTYGHDYERKTADLYKNGVNVYKKLYMGDGCELHEDMEQGTPEEAIFYVTGGDGICAIVTQTQSDEHIYYPSMDHLGSINNLVDESNTVVYEQSFDAWGRYRDVQTWQMYNPYYTPPTAFAWMKGFTGHEHLPQFALINMNARMYDPVLGRMLAPDNYIQNPIYTQSYNRYSYCWNNPLKYTDPSGNILGVLFFASAYLGELGSNLIQGENRPFAKAFNSAQNATSVIGSLGQIPVYQNGYTTVTAGIDIFGLGLSANYSYQDGDFSAHAGIGVGLMSGPSASAGISQRLHIGSTDYVTLGVGAGTNFSTYSLSASASYTNAGVSVGYAYNKYGGEKSDGYGPQYTGTFSIGINDFHFSVENDFLAFGNASDKFRTQAMEIGAGPFSIGSKINTNDPKGEGSGTGNQLSGTWGFNKRYDKYGLGSWNKGEVYASDIYAQYRYGSSISRIGYNHPDIQDVVQNGVHQSWFIPGNQNYYLGYNHFQHGASLYGGSVNPYSLYTK